MTCYRYSFLNVSGLCNIHLEWVCVVWFKAETYVTILLNIIALTTTATIVSTLGGRTTLPDADTAFSAADRRMKNERGGMVLLGELEALREKSVPVLSCLPLTLRGMTLKRSRPTADRQSPRMWLLSRYAHECNYSVNSDAFASLCLLGYSVRNGSSKWIFWWDAELTQVLLGHHCSEAALNTCKLRLPYFYT